MNAAKGDPHERPSAFGTGPADTSVNLFALVGRERNGAFYTPLNLMPAPEPME